MGAPTDIAEVGRRRSLGKAQPYIRMVSIGSPIRRRPRRLSTTRCPGLSTNRGDCVGCPKTGVKRRGRGRLNSNSDQTIDPQGSGYRIGFHHAFWAGVTKEADTNVLRTAKWENVLACAANLYHYTSLAGLHGIIKEAGFWASDNRFMNDAAEQRHGAEVAVRVLLHCQRRFRCRRFSDILEGVIDNIRSASKTGTLVACFSTARDSLEQWRGYGPFGAVCIGIGGNKEGERPLFYGPSCLPYQAFYDERPKLILLLSIIRRYESEYDLDLQAMSEHWPTYHDKQYIDHLTTHISSSIVAFKNSAFKMESEIRIVIPYSAEKHFSGGLKFRESPLGLIPYVCTGNMKGLTGLLPIREVIVGPSPRQELIGESIRIFLDHNGYSEVAVSMSSVPFRSS